MGLSLPRRPVLLGNQIMVNTQHKGDSNVAALYIPFRRLTLTPEELPNFCLEDKAYKLLYRKYKGRPDEAIWGKLSPIFYLPQKMTGVSAVLYLGRRQLKVIDCTIKNLQLQWQSGGNTWLHGQLQCVPDLDEDHPIITSLVSRVNEEIDLELSCDGYGEQAELELEEKEDVDPDADEETPATSAAGEDEDSELSNTGKRIAADLRRKRKRADVDG